MGMDVRGIGNPEAYFRANIWTWPRVWMLSMIAAPEITEKVQYPWTNDGDGLKDPEDCVKLAQEIRKTVALQRKVVVPYPDDPGALEQREKHETLLKDLSEGKIPGSSKGDGLEGKRKVVADGREDDSLPAEYVENWCRFLETCEGFQIW